MKRNVNHWLRGLISSVAGAASAPLGLLVFDQGHNHDWHMLLKVAMGPTIVALLSYLSKHPTPDDDEEVK